MDNKPETPVSKSRKFSPVWIIVGVVVMIGVCCLCTLVYFVFLAAPTTTITTSATSSASNSKAFKVGDEAQTDGLSLVVNEFSNSVSVDNEFLKPKEGSKYVGVDVKITNNSRVEKYIFQGSFSLKDSNDFKYNAVYFDIKTPSLKAGDLATGDTIRGWLTFEVPVDATDLKLSFGGGLLNDNEVQISLGD